MAENPPVLIIFGGLPGAGKTTLAKAIATRAHAVYLRIDTIEQALRSSGELKGEVGPSGYMVACRLAIENLRMSQSVVADSVNPLKSTREAWLAAAAEAEANGMEIEVICSDLEEHRRRVETRASEIEGLPAISWQAVLARQYQPWKADLVFDTAGKAPEQAADELVRALISLRAQGEAPQLYLGT